MCAGVVACHAFRPATTLARAISGSAGSRVAAFPSAVDEVAAAAAFAYPALLAGFGFATVLNRGGSLTASDVDGPDAELLLRGVGRANVAVTCGLGVGGHRDAIGPVGEVVAAVTYTGRAGVALGVGGEVAAG